ncbi:MAG TPA: hypothetical protein EYG74_08125 [Sulfurimonas autotrophica]|nr:hypothetical protein [Sulfurimonas autotrophica]
MLNIHDLEKRWKVYKIKSFIPYIVTIALLVIVTIVYIFSTNKVQKPVQQKELPKIKETKIAIPLKKQKQKLKPEMKPTIENNISKKTTAIQTLKPSMGFIKNIQHQSIQSQYKIQKVDKKQPLVQKKRKVVKPTVIEEIVEDISAKKTAPMKKEKKVAITIERRETKNDIFEVVKRFRKSNDPALSLFVAKKYYELGNYEQAYNYALITNQINSDIEASWIVFTKALVKLHKKDKAIHTLEEYIKVSHSSNAEILLHEIKSGKFQ